MKIKDYKAYLPFFASIILFLIIIFYCLHIYLRWDKEIVEEAPSVEVNLPVIDWGKYTTLSKQYNTDTINQNN